MTSSPRRVARQYLPARVRRTAVRLTGRRLSATAPEPRGRRERDRAPASTRVPAVQHPPVVDLLRAGASLDEAVVAQVRELVAHEDWAVVSAVAASLARQQDSARLGALVGGIVAFRRGYPRLAWWLLAGLPDEVWARHAAEEFVRSGLHVESETMLRRVGGLAESSAGSLPAESWLGMLGPVSGHGDTDLARRLFARLDQAVGTGQGVSDGVVENRDWLRRWVAATPDGRSAEPVGEGRVSFAIMDYGHPGRARASANIGDHVQSLASLGNVVRQQRVAFTGEQDLVDLAHQLQGRVRPERQLDDVAAELRLLAVDRDASMYSAVPPDTWTLAFGWFMHAIYDVRFGFPFHPNLLPIFVSFHCSRPGLLTEEAITYLRRFAPIGCRDWTTVDVLLSVDVPAFFSGCMTTTVQTVFPDIPERPGPDADVAYVDMPGEAVPAGAPTYRHSNDAIRFRSFASNTYDAVELLETYRRRHPGLVTSRLHCYLPSRSLGVPVDFQPGNRSDPRFAGLIDITDAEFTRMREGIDDKLRRVLTEVFSGRPAEQVYEVWREINADDVEAARRRRNAPVSMPPAKVDLAAEVAALRQARPLPAADPGHLHLVTHVPAGRQHALEVLLASAADHTDRPLHVWALTRRPASLDEEALRRAAPGVRVTVVGTGGLGASIRRGTGGKPSARDLDLLSLPWLLPDVDRVVVLPVDSLVLADVAELADLDLDGRLLAAPTVVGTRGASGFGLLHAAGIRLRARTAAATELRRQGHARHRFDFDAFDTDVLVLDLARLRGDDALETQVGYIEEFGLTFREILLLRVGPDRVVLPERWHAVPQRSVVDEPALLHWADDGKPWSEDAVQDQERWLSVAVRTPSGAAGRA